MIHCIVGHGASGKSTVQEHLKKNIPPIVTFTTRPKRDYEIDGKHYHFISNEDFEKALNDGFFVEHYYIPENKWYYGISLIGVWYEFIDYSLVLDPQGYKTLLEKIGKEHLRCYFINIKEHERLIRMARRTDKIEEIFRRILADRKDFEGFSKYADKILQDWDSRKNYKAILEMIGVEAIEK